MERILPFVIHNYSKYISMEFGDLLRRRLKIAAQVHIILSRQLRLTQPTLSLINLWLLSLSNASNSKPHKFSLYRLSCLIKLIVSSSSKSQGRSYHWESFWHISRRLRKLYKKWNRIGIRDKAGIRRYCRGSCKHFHKNCRQPLRENFNNFTNSFSTTSAS